MLRTRAPQPRRGMSVLVVLLLISMTLALSYAAVRTQSTAVRIQRNSDRRLTAQQCAVTGMTIALKKMHKSDWAGVDTTLTGSLSSYDSFQVAYTTGDPSLVSGSTNYSEYPYRVTLLATGYSADPDNPQYVATQQVRAVVRLVPRKLSDEPASWTNMLKFTVYQWTSGTCALTVPARVEGPVLFQGTMRMSRELNWSDTARERYYGDLNQIRLARDADWRPYNAQISLWNFAQHWDTLDILRNKLGLATANVWPSTISWTFPGELATYQLYPGGKTYNVAPVNPSLQNVALQPDMQTNPLGVFYRAGQIDVYDNVSIQGVLVTKRYSGADVNIRGKNVRLQPVSLPALYGTSQPVQLPAAIVGDDLFVLTGGAVNITGQTSVYDNFDVAGDGQAATSMTLAGQLTAGGIAIHARSEWNRTSWWWDTQYSNFDDQKGLASGIKYFPDYLQAKQALDPTPRLTIKPDTASVRYHWHNWTNPIFVADPSDGGLRWELVEWKENP